MSSPIFLPSIFQQQTTEPNNASYNLLMFLILIIGVAVMVYMYFMNKEQALHTAFGDTSAAGISKT